MSRLERIVFVAAPPLVMGLLALWAIAEIRETDPPVTEKQVCEVLAVHPAMSGGDIVTFECPPGVIQ